MNREATAPLRHQQHQGSTGNVIAALASVFVPGLGQLIQGRWMAAAIFFLVVSVGAALWFLVVPGIIAGIAYLWGIIDAARWR